jgi:hypothetical protein
MNFFTLFNMNSPDQSLFFFIVGLLTAAFSIYRFFSGIKRIEKNYVKINPIFNYFRSILYRITLRITKCEAIGLIIGILSILLGIHLLYSVGPTFPFETLVMRDEFSWTRMLTKF